MEIGICQPIKHFNFYSLEEFDYQQLISKSKYFVGSFLNKQTKLNYVVKQIPYDQKILLALKKLDRLNHHNITPLLGVSLHRSKTGWNQNQRLKPENHNHNSNNNNKEYNSLLLFMQKYEMNLMEYVVSRRKKNQPFSRQQVNNFLGQMLLVLEQLQLSNIAHRDIKPQNILYNKGTYLLCDFDDILTTNARQKLAVDLTTVQYSSPQFLKNIRQPKQKYFDPFKLDVYSLGLTLLYMCSMGRFSLEERSQYIYQSSQHSHADFIKEERRKYIAKSSQFKSFNPIVKMMLEEDQYKRDDFITLTIKTKNKGEYERAYSDYNKSDDKSATVKTKQNKKAKKMLRAKRQSQLQQKQTRVYGFLCFCMAIVFLLLCLL